MYVMHVHKCTYVNMYIATYGLYAYFLIAAHAYVHVYVLILHTIHMYMHVHTIAIYVRTQLQSHANNTYVCV